MCIIGPVFLEVETGVPKENLGPIVDFFNLRKNV
jgi:hypothetical protein